MRPFPEKVGDGFGWGEVGVKNMVGVVKDGIEEPLLSFLLYRR